jgi:hemolysin III
MKLFGKNEPFSAITHLIAGLLSIAALTLMVVFAANYGKATHVVGFSIFGASLIFLYFTSAIYHFFPRETKIKRIFQRIDHSMIYVLIAGTYTPIALLMPDRVWGWTIFGIIWGCAVFGIVIKSTGIKIKEWMSVALYIAMGWLAILPIRQLLQWLSFEAFMWLLIGGIFYTTGCIFFSLERFLPRKKWFGMHEIFHLFVISGSFCHFWLMMNYLY